MLRRAKQIDLDANATTQLSAGVRRRMLDVLDRAHGNPSAAHQFGRDAAAVIARARDEVAAAVCADASEIVFNSGASEGNNQVLRTAAARRTSSRSRLVLAPVEHASVVEVGLELASCGVEVTWLPVDSVGRVSPSSLAAVMDQDVVLVSCMLANNELGTINPIRELAAIAHDHGALFHADCVQGLGKIPVDVRALDVDYATFSAHKIHGPKGAGVLFARAGAPLDALISGGRQENGRRAGTESTHNIAGCGAAFAGVPKLLGNARATAARRDRLRDRLAAVCPAMIENSPRDGVLPNTLNVRFPGFRSSDILAFMDLHGVAVSTGSACSAQLSKASHVLRAIGRSDDEARESVRFSLSELVSDRDIDTVVDLVRRYARGDTSAPTLLSPAQLDAHFFAEEQHYILDVRLNIERRLIPSLPGSHEVPFLGFKRWLDRIPRDRHVVVVCSTGVDASIVAWALKGRGFSRVSVLRGGLLGWRVAQPRV
jgi:cysteine desulfurase